MYKKNAASASAANKNSKIMARGVRTAGATVVEDEVMKKTGLMVDVVSTPKTLSIQLEASASTKNHGEMMEVSNTSELSPVVEANTSTMKEVDVDEGRAAGFAVSTKPPLDPEASGGGWKAALPKAVTLGKLPVVRSSSSALPLGGASTDKSMMIGASTPKTTGTHSEAVGSKPKTREGDVEDEKEFLYVNGRGKDIGEEEMFSTGM